MEILTDFSAIVVTINEAKHLEDCLASLSFCAEILVYDMGSTDESVPISQKYATEVRRIERVDIVEKIWNKVVTEAKHDWIILVDPDEIFPTSIFPEISDLIKTQPEVALISLPWKFYFLGKPLTSTIWGTRKYKARVFNKKNVEISGLLFGGIKPKPGHICYTFPYYESNAILHYWIDSIAQLYSKHWRYVKNDGESRYKKGERFSFRKLLTDVNRSLQKNFKEYNGFHDGLRGIHLSLFHAWFTLMCHFSLCYYQLLLSRKMDDTKTH